MIGARDMAFPRLNALSFWLFLFGGMLMYRSFLVGGAPDAGWIAYAPLSGRISPVGGIDFWIMGLLVIGRRLNRGRDQFHGHDPQHARARA